MCVVAKVEIIATSSSVKIKKREKKTNQQWNPTPPPSPREKEYVCRNESEEEGPKKKKVKKNKKTKKMQVILKLQAVHISKHLKKDHLIVFRKNKMFVIWIKMDIFSKLVAVCTKKG